MALIGVAQCIECQLMNQRATDWIFSQGTWWACGSDPQQGMHDRQPHIGVSLPLFLSSFPSLQKERKKILKIKKKSFFKSFYCCSSTVVCIYSPPTPPHTRHGHLPPLILCPHPSFVHVSFVLFLKTLPSFRSIFSSHLPSGYCQIVLNFNASVSILLACLLC